MDNQANFGLEEQNKSYKNRNGRKRWTIEYRVNPESRWYGSKWWSKDWKVWQRYNTEKARGEALRAYQRKSQQKNNWEHNFFYRAG